MDFELTEEQKLLGDITRDVLSRGYDVERLNQVMDTELGWSREVWEQLAEVGILGLGFDPHEAGQLEIMVVLTELGKRLAPEPVASAALIPGGVIAELGTEHQKASLEDVASGQRLLAFAHQEPGMRQSTCELTTHAVRQGDVWSITGRKAPVTAADSADALVVSATLSEGGVGLFLVDSAATERTPFRTFDGRRGANVVLEAAAAEPLGEGGDASEHVSRTLVRQQSALCAEAVGAMTEALRLTTEYLTSRKQFGVPLSNFQTLTQRAADMYVSLELARSMNFYAAMSIAEGNFDPVIAARAKLQIARSGRHIAQEAIQLHGGIGMTAEYPVGHYAARLTAIGLTSGTADDQLRTLSAHIGSYGTVAL